MMNQNAYSQKPSRQFYSVLLKYEEKATSKSISLDELSQMTRMYGDLVSYYDSQLDPIKYYFMEKIQTFCSEVISQKNQQIVIPAIIAADRRISITDIKKTRQKKLTHLIQLKEVQKEEQTTFNEILGSYVQNVSENDISIKHQLDTQSSALKDRLEQRKQKVGSRLHSAQSSRTNIHEDDDNIEKCEDDQNRTSISPTKSEVIIETDEHPHEQEEEHDNL